MLLPFRNLFATPKNNNLPPSAFGNDSRLCLALAAQKKHTTHKCNISTREPRGTDVILAHFLYFHPYKKCAKITSVPPGSLADMLHLRVVCFFCAASARQRRESSLSQWWRVVVFGLWQTNSETAIIENKHKERKGPETDTIVAYACTTMFQFSTVLSFTTPCTFTTSCTTHSWLPDQTTHKYNKFIYDVYRCYLCRRGTVAPSAHCRQGNP